MEPTQFLAVYEEWVNGLVTQPQAATRLGMAERTFRRYVVGFRAQGRKWLERKSPQRPPDRSAPGEEITALRNLYSTRYSSWNVAHFYERYRDAHNGQRSYVWVKRQLQAAGLVTKGGSRNTARQRSPGCTLDQRGSATLLEGVIIHYFATRYEWVAEQSWDLIVTVDDATKRVHSGFLVDNRDIWSVFRSVREVLLRRGVLETLTLSGSELDYGIPTGREQLSRAMKELGVTLSLGDRRRRFGSARVLRTIKGRLPQELAAARINMIGEANAFLTEFWAAFNPPRAVACSATRDAFVPLSPSDQAMLNDILCLKRRAAVGFGNYVRSNRGQLPIPHEVRRQVAHCQQVSLHEYEDGSIALVRGSKTLTTLPPTSS